MKKPDLTPDSPLAIDSEAAEVLSRIGEAKRPPWQRALAYGVIVLAVVGAVGAWVLFKPNGGADDRRQYVTQSAETGTLVATVTATGNLGGLDTVEVGAETSGRIQIINVDFNDPVTKGQLLVEIDPQQQTASRNQARAQLIAARAELKNRRASAAEAKLNADRTRAMVADGLSSNQQLESATAAAARAEAAMESASAQITVANASLTSAQTALERTKVLSPISGVVLSRLVEPGQTVVAAMQTPILFTLARDLKDMELTVSVDEADIGRVKVGQQASFRVDAYPDKTFPTRLKAIHNVSELKDNIVTYQAELTVDNPELLLRPGMTATVTITTSKRENILLVPNMGFRFSMPNDTKRTMFSGGGPGGGPGGGGKPKVEDKDTRPSLWVLRDDVPTRIRVTKGQTDGQRTEVTSGDLKSGEAVIVDLFEEKKKKK